MIRNQPLLFVLLFIGHVLPQENIAVKDLERINISTDNSKVQPYHFTSDVIALKRHKMLEDSKMKCVIRTRYMELESINRIGFANFDENSQNINNIKNLQNSLNSILSSSIKTLFSKGELTSDDMQNIFGKTGVILSNQIGKNYGVKLEMNTSASTGRGKDNYWITLSKKLRL